MGKKILLPEKMAIFSRSQYRVQATETEDVVLLNNDNIPTPDWLLVLHDHIRSAPRDVTALASCLTKMDYPGEIDDAGDSQIWFDSA